MNDHGGESGAKRRSRLTDYADMSMTTAADGTPQAPARPPASAPPDPTTAGWTPPSPPPADPGAPGAWRPATPIPPGAPGAYRGDAPGTSLDAEAEARLREFATVLEVFRETAVLVPRRYGALLTTDFGGVRWILAFTNESALARYAIARGEGGAEWEYETVLGARLLDAAVPSAGVPCGVALDAADGEEHAVLFPPVAGVVPDGVAVDKGCTGVSETGAQA